MVFILFSTTIISAMSSIYPEYPSNHLEHLSNHITKPWQCFDLNFSVFYFIFLIRFLLLLLTILLFRYNFIFLIEILLFRFNCSVLVFIYFQLVIFSTYLIFLRQHF